MAFSRQKSLKFDVFYTQVPYPGYQILKKMRSHSFLESGAKVAFVIEEPPPHVANLQHLI